MPNSKEQTRARILALLPVYVDPDTPGLNPTEIADATGLSPHTVRRHLTYLHSAGRAWWQHAFDGDQRKSEWFREN